MLSAYFEWFNAFKFYTRGIFGHWNFFSRGIHLVLRPLFGITYQPRMTDDDDDDDDCGVISGMRIGRGNRSTRRKSAPIRIVHHKSHVLNRATNRLSYGTTHVTGTYISSNFLSELCSTINYSQSVAYQGLRVVLKTELSLRNSEPHHEEV
jgi:hypothetical protein